MASTLVLGITWCVMVALMVSLGEVSLLGDVSLDIV